MISTSELEVSNHNDSTKSTDNEIFFVITHELIPALHDEGIFD